MDHKGTFVHWTSDKKEIIHIVYGFNNFEYAYECINARYIKMSCLVVILIWHLRVVKWYALFLGTFDITENVFIWLQSIQNMICMACFMVRPFLSVKYRKLFVMWRFKASFSNQTLCLCSFMFKRYTFIYKLASLITVRIIVFKELK